MLRHVVLLLTLTFVAAGCADESGSEAKGDSPTTTVGAPATASDLSDWGHETRPLFAAPVWTPSAVSPLAATLELVTTQPVKLRLTATAGDHRVTSPWTAEPEQEHTLPLVGLRSDRTYDVRIAALLPDGETDYIDSSFTTGTLPENIPKFDITIDTDRAAPGVTVLELNPVQAVRDGIGNPIVAIDSEGEVVWYYQSGELFSAFTGAVSQGPNGTVFAQNHPFGAREFTIDGRLVRAISADPTGEAKITPIEGGGLNVPYHAEWINLRTVHHDISPMPDNTVIFLSSALHEITPEQRAAVGCPPDDTFEWNPFSDVIVHMDADGTVLRTWDLWDFISFDDLHGNFLCQRQGIDVTELERDWTHANSLVFDPERRAIIVSVRHTDQLIALDFTDDLGPQTGVRWILGEAGTMPYKGESFHHTHGAMVDTDGSIVLYDNGNFRPGTVLADGDAAPYSRAVRIEVDDESDDPAQWSARQVWDHVLEDPKTGTPAFAPFVSDADALPNGNVLVTHGGLGGFASFQHVHILEYAPEGDRNGDSVWELQLGEPGDEITVYRADRWESLYFGPLWESP
jgi:hypothetical protein